MAKRYWLFKSEPGCFSIEDLKNCPNMTDCWDGVRNYQARNFLRDDVEKGDLVLFHYSNISPAGVAGICEITKEGYPDHTAWDPNEQHFDPKTIKDNPIWYMVDVKYKRTFKELISLPLLKQTLGLEKMVLTQKGSRLSIQPVTPEEWKIVLKLAR